MATTSTPAQFAAKLHRFPTLLDKAARAGTEAMAREVKKSVGIQLVAAGVKGGRLRGVGKKGAKIGVRYTISAGASHPSALVKMTGPAHLLERDTKAHEIPRQRRRGRRRYVVIPGIGVRTRAMHPGTQGKYPWRKGMALARPRLPAIQMKHYAGSLKKALG